jgi:hypothetical protein
MVVNDKEPLNVKVKIVFYKGQTKTSWHNLKTFFERKNSISAFKIIHSGSYYSFSGAVASIYDDLLG